MITAFELFAKLGLDDSSFKQGVNEAEKSGKDLGNSLANSFGKIKKAAAVVISVAGVKKGIDTIREFARETAAAGDKIDKQSQALGMSRKAYQEWDYILSQSGVSIDSMSVAMKTLNSFMGSALTGSEEATQAFLQLGLSAEDMLGKSQEDQFEAVVKAFQKMPAGAQKSALAIKFFGRQGMQLLPLLNSSSTSIDELRQKASDLGLIMSDDAVDASVKYSDALDTMQRTFDSIKYKIGAKFLPMFTNVMEKVTGYAGKLGKAFEENGLTGVFNTLKTDLRSFVQELKESDNPVLQTLGDALDGVLDTVETIVGLFTDFDGTVATLEQSDTPVLKALGKSLKEIRSVFNVIVGLFTNFDATVAELQQSDNPVLTILAEAIVTVKDGIQAIIDLINGDWQSALQTLRDSDSGILQTVGIVVDTFAQAEDRIRGAIDAAKEFFGISGSSGKLYETFAGKMGLSYKDIQDQSGLDAWINELSEGLKDAGFDSGLSKSLTEYIRGLDYSDVNIQNQVAQMLRDLSDPKQVDKGSLIKTWLAAQQINEEHKEEMQAVVKDLEVPEDQKEKIRKETQEALDKDPFKIRLMIEAGEFDPSKVAPQGNMWGSSNPDGSNAKGMWDVPYDDYVSKLHRGEMVLSASQARDYRDGAQKLDLSGIKEAIIAAIKDGMSGVTVDSYLDGEDVTDRVSRRLAMQMANLRYV